MTLRAEVYSGTTVLPDERRELQSALRSVRYNTFYPGGIFGSLEMTVHRNVAEYWAANKANRIVIREGFEIAWEGKIDNLKHALSTGGQGTKIGAIGMWGVVLARWSLNKPWADNRLQKTLWPFLSLPDTAKKDLFRHDYYNRLLTYPAGGALATNDEGRFTYQATPGTVIKRITFTEEMQEGAYNLILEVYDVTNATTLYSRSTSGTSSQDITLSPTSSKIIFRLRSLAAQTPPSDGTIFANFTAVTVFTETGLINLTEIAKDVRAYCTDLNSTDMYISQIGTNLHLVPFYSDGWQDLAGILSNASAYGDENYNAWAVYLDHSEKAPSPDGKPVLVVEQYPSLTAGFDYLVRFNNLDKSYGEVSIEEDYSSIYNYIVVQYYDAETGEKYYASPSDDATLKDQTSIDLYGQRMLVIDVRTTNLTLAKQYGVRYLQQYKFPIIRMSSPIVVAGTLETSQGNHIPVSLARAGKRLLLTDFMGKTVNFLITSTEYSDGKLTLNAGNGGRI